MGLLIILGTFIAIITCVISYQVLYIAIYKKKKQFKFFKKINIFKAIVFESIVEIVLIFIFIVVIALEGTFINIGISSIISRNKESEICTCYCKCTRDNEYGYLSNYRWCFGENAYLEFLGTIFDEDEISELNNETSTQWEKDSRILEEANYFEGDGKRFPKETIEVYRKHATSNKQFCTLHNVNREDFDDIALNSDLIRLLSQRRENNVTVSCEECKKSIAGCRGIGRFVESKGYNIDTDSGFYYGSSVALNGYRPGKAVGPYAIQLDDGWWYWYNQGNAAYGNNLPEKDFYWGTSANSTYTLSRNGCGIFTLAMMISNLVGYEVTAHDILMNMDSNFVNGNRYVLSTDYFVPQVSLKYYPLENLANKYGLGCEIGTIGIDGVDRLYDEHEYVFIMFHQEKPSSWSSSNEHFMTIRKRQDGKYYCLNSTGGKDNYLSMNYPMERSELAGLVGGTLIAFWMDYPEDYGSGNGTISLNIDSQQVYNKLVAAGYNKAYTASIIYQEMINAGCSCEEAIGMLANIHNEGNFGIVEESFAKKGYFGFKLPSGGSNKIKNMADIEYLLNWTATSQEKEHGIYKGSCGVGCIQASWSRRVNMLNNYKKYMSTDADVTEENIILAESEFIINEYLTTYRATIISAMQGKENTSENWAEAICDYDIKPRGICGSMKGTGACASRRQSASDIERILK